MAWNSSARASAGTPAALMGAAAIGFVAGLAGPTVPEAAAQDNLRNRIVVTATRRPESVFEQAGNTAVLDAEALQFIRANHPSEALNRLPGVYLHRNNGVDQLTAIRSPVLTGGAGAGSFLFLEDGVPLRSAGFANVNALFESVSELAVGTEVVRGPGSVLYGSNAVHGLVNVVLPSAFDEERGFLTVSGGSFGRKRGEAGVRFTAGNHGIFAGLSLTDEEGWRDDTSVDQQKLLLLSEWQKGSVSVRTSLAAQNLNQESAGFVVGPAAYKNSILSQTNPSPQAFRDARSVRLQSRIDWQRDETFTLSVTPYARWTDLDFILFFLPSNALEENSHASVGMLTTGYWSLPGGHEIVLGADWEVTDGMLREVQDEPTIFSFTQGTHYDYEILAVTVAGYAQGTWQATPRLSVTGGLRLDYTRYDYDNQTEDGIVGRFLRAPDRVDDFFLVTPKLGALYAVDDDTSLYARYARGARAPQTTDLYRLQINQTVGEVEPEKLDSIEVGMRKVWPRLSFDLAAYFAEKRNFFFRDTDGFNVSNGRTRHTGVELEAILDIFDTLSLQVSGTYARHTYRFDNSVNANATETIRFGDDVDSAPRLLGNTRLVWTPLDGLRSELEWIYVGDYFTDASNSNRYPGHQVFNLRAAYDVTDNFQIFTQVINLTNTDYANRADFAFGNQRFFPGEDRAFNGGIRVSF